MGLYANCVMSDFAEKTSTFIIPIYNQQPYAHKKQIFKLRSFYDTLFLPKRQTELVSARLILCKDA